MITFKEYFKIGEEEGDFGDDAVEASAKQSTMNAQNVKAMRKWIDARGFIEPNGKVNRIDTMSHEGFAMDIAKFDSVREMCLNNGFVRWSPETQAFAVYKVMTPEQIKVVKSILKAYGYAYLRMEFFNKQTGNMEEVSFADGNPRTVDSKLARVQHFVRDDIKV
jgi:hypothetical protein